MSHASEEQLVQYYYGEGGDAVDTEHHLSECQVCRESYTLLQQVLNTVDTLPVPERPADYEERLWLRLESKLPLRHGWLGRFEWRWVAGVAVVAAMLVAAFLAGRVYPAPARPLAAASDARWKEAALLVAMDDYLERSQMVLVELANAAAGPLDISSEQERAADLITENRLYRQTAGSAGDTSMVSVLDDLERVLIEITHAPGHLSPEELGKLREKVRGEGILFKMRVLGANVRSRLEPAGQKL